MDQRTAISRTAEKSEGSAFTRWARRIETTKVGPMTIVIFIAMLGLFSALAAGIGYVTHHLPGRIIHPVTQGDTGHRGPPAP